MSHEAYKEFINRMDQAIGQGKTAVEFFESESLLETDRPIGIEAIRASLIIPPRPKVKGPKPEDMTFMGYKVHDMTREGLLEVVKYQWWDKGDMAGQCEGSADLDKIAQTEPSPLPRREALEEASQGLADSMKETFVDILKQATPRKEAISVQPGDVIVTSIECGLSQVAFQRIEEALDHTFPDNKALVLDQGMTLEVYREQGKPAGNQEICDSHRGDCSECDEVCKSRINSIGGGKEKVVSDDS